MAFCFQQRHAEIILNPFSFSWRFFPHTFSIFSSSSSSSFSLSLSLALYLTYFPPFIVFFPFIFESLPVVLNLIIPCPSQLLQVVSEQHFQTQMPSETRSQDARRVDETTNPKHPQAYDQIQQQLNDTRVDANVRFRELKEVMDALISHVDTALQKTQLSSGESSLPKAPWLPTTRDSLTRFNWANEGTPPQYHLHRPKREFPIFEGEDVLKWIYKCN